MAQIFKKMIFNLRVPPETISAPPCASRPTLIREQQGLPASQGKVLLLWPGAEGHPSTDATPSPTKGTVPQGLKRSSRVRACNWVSSINSPSHSQQWTRSWVPPGGTASRGKRDRGKLQRTALGVYPGEHIYLEHSRSRSRGRLENKHTCHAAQSEPEGPGLKWTPLGVGWSPQVRLGRTIKGLLVHSGPWQFAHKQSN